MQLNEEKKDKLKRVAAISSVSLALVLCLLKTGAFYYTNSLAVFSSMIDSLSDIFASLITFFAVRVSVRPATFNYRYGYGKVEALSALFQSLFVVASGVFVLWDAILRIKNPVSIEQTTEGLFVMGFSLVSTIILVAFQKKVAKVTESQAILADSMHYYVDILTNFSIIISLFSVKFFQVFWIDTAVAVLIAVYLLYNAYDLGRDAVRMLLDKELSEEIRNSVFKIVSGHVKGLQMHDLRTRSMGNFYVFEFHLEMDGNLTLNEAHAYTEEIEVLIRKVYPSAQIIIHQDPRGIDEERLDNILV